MKIFLKLSAIRSMPNEVEKGIDMDPGSHVEKPNFFGGFEVANYST